MGILQEAPLLDRRCLGDMGIIHEFSLLERKRSIQQHSPASPIPADAVVIRRARVKKCTNFAACTNVSRQEFVVREYMYLDSIVSLPRHRQRGYNIGNMGRNFIPRVGN
jgi:hypothetical protein